MGSILRWLSLLFAVLLLAQSQSPLDPPTEEDDEVYFAQNVQYVDPHYRMDGTYVPGYYRPPGNTQNFPAGSNPNPVYFNTGNNPVPYSNTYGGALYFRYENNAVVPMTPYSYYP